MNAFEFLNKLNAFYPSNESDSVFKERVSEYVDSIVRKGQQNRCKYDYEKVFTYILENYKYKTFPSLPDILNALPKGRIVELKFSGREGDEIMRKYRGYDYEFTVVPNHWEKVKTIKELNEEIERYDTGAKSA